MCFPSNQPVNILDFNCICTNHFTKHVVKTYKLNSEKIKSYTMNENGPTIAVIFEIRSEWGRISYANGYDAAAETDWPPPEKRRERQRVKSS